MVPQTEMAKLIPTCAKEDDREPAKSFLAHRCLVVRKMTESHFVCYLSPMTVQYSMILPVVMILVILGGCKAKPDLARKSSSKSQQASRGQTAGDGSQAKKTEPSCPPPNRMVESTKIKHPYGGVIKCARQMACVSANGMLHGPYRAVHADGSRCIKVRYMHDKPHGKFTAWHASGNQAASGTYSISGSMIGTWKYWREDGAPAMVQRFNAIGIKHGEMEYWHKNGKLSRIERWANGASLKGWKCWDEQGKKVRPYLECWRR